MKNPAVLMCGWVFHFDLQKKRLFVCQRNLSQLIHEFSSSAPAGSQKVPAMNIHRL
jgi:hypothetical protein